MAAGDNIVVDENLSLEEQELDRSLVMQKNEILDLLEEQELDRSLVMQKNEILDLLEDAYREFNSGRYHEGFVATERAIFTIAVLQRMWDQMNYAYKTGELVRSVEQMLEHHSPESYAPAKTRAIQRLRSLAVLALHGQTREPDGERRRND